jgi:4'-phosphopantetheinyl transferase
VAALARLLGAEERARAERFHFARDRDRYVASHGMLRSVLGRYAGQPGPALRFAAGPHGKPALALPAGSDLRFNLSHSGDLALLAVARGREVGVDVEQVAERAWMEVARRFFSSREQSLLAELPDGARPEAFFRCWTRKEAYIKARGLGLHANLTAFDVSLAPGEPAALLRAADDPVGPEGWQLVDLAPAPGYAGALAVEGDGWGVACWDWQP